VAKQQILGINFFDGSVGDVVEEMSRRGGFLAAPSGTCFARLRRDVPYREAIVRADIAIPDSGAMVLFWRILRRKKISRISGFKYIQRLSARIFAAESKTLWVLPNESARTRTSQWLRANKSNLSTDSFYVAPIYRPQVEDEKLLREIEARKPAHVVVAIGSGPQEKLGFYLRERLTYRPAIHCIGAALGFMTGDQVAIPDWADRFYLGWLFRLFSQPRIFVPRLARALELPWLILRYGSELPPLRKSRK